MQADNTSVAAYHRSLSSHLSALLRDTESRSTCPATTSYDNDDDATHSNAATVAPTSRNPTSLQSQTLAGSSDSRQSSAPGLASDSIGSSRGQTVVTPEEYANMCREREHERVWKEHGRKLCNNSPPDFNLYLQSNVPTATRPSILLRRSRDLATSMGMRVHIVSSDSKRSQQGGSPYHRPAGAECEGATSQYSEATRHHAASDKSPTPTRRDLPQRPRSAFAATDGANGTQAEYETRKAMHHKRKYAEVAAKVDRWRQSILTPLDFVSMLPALTAWFLIPVCSGD